MSPTTFTGVGVLTSHNEKPIIITAGDLETIKGYLGEQQAEGDPEICQVSVTVGPRAERPAIVLDVIPLKTTEE